MPDDLKIEQAELRAVARYAAACAETVLSIFEDARPGDARPRLAIEAANGFARGAARTNSIRDAAWAAQRAAHGARDAGLPAAGEAARAALAAAGAAFLHPLAKATQVRHILGAAAHAARAFELAVPDEADRMAHRERLRSAAPPSLADILRRYPAAPPGGGRVGEWIRAFDTWFR